MTTEALLLRPEHFYTAQNITLRLSTKAEKVDAARHCVTLSSGEEVPYDHLILATGAYARTLATLNIPGAGFDNVLTLRSLGDAERIRRFLTPGKTLAIIGGGYVGLECAATAKKMGADVVLIERTTRLLERVASAPVSAFLQEYHQRQGVTFLLHTEIDAIEGNTASQPPTQAPGQLATAIRLADGRRIACDAVLVGIGASPATALAQTAALTCQDGIVVDSDCRSSDPAIFALGDVARRPHSLYQRDLRLESVPGVLEQARRIAAILTGRAAAAAEVPWFWSDQYDLKLQIAGLPFAATETRVKGNPALSTLVVYHLQQQENGHRVVSVETINSPQDFMAGKKWISSGAIIDPDFFQDLFQGENNR